MAPDQGERTRLLEPVEFYSSGTRLAGDVYRPSAAGTAAGLPAVVLCQGFGGIKRFYMPQIATELARRGYVALVFDYRGFGESDGARDRLFPAEQVADVRAAVTYVGMRKDVDPARIALLGTSFGGAIAVDAASRDRRVAGVASAVGVARGETWLRGLRRYWEWRAFLAHLEEDRVKRVRTGRSDLVDPGEVLLRDPESEETAAALTAAFPGRAYRLSLESAEAVLEFAPVDRVARIAPRPSLFLGLSDDTLTPIDETIALYERAEEPKELVVFDGLPHHAIYESPHLERFVGVVVSFLDRHFVRRGGDR